MSSSSAAYYISRACARDRTGAAGLIVKALGPAIRLARYMVHFVAERAPSHVDIYETTKSPRKRQRYLTADLGNKPVCYKAL